MAAGCGEAQNSTTAYYLQYYGEGRYWCSHGSAYRVAVRAAHCLALYHAPRRCSVRSLRLPKASQDTSKCDIAIISGIYPYHLRLA